MNNDDDTIFNKFFVRDRDSKVSFTVLSDKLNLDEELLLQFLSNKKLEIGDKSGRKYLIGWKYRDDAKTPTQSSNINSMISNTTSHPPQQKSLKPIIEVSDDSIQRKKDELERYRLAQELEEHKRQIKLKNREIDNYKESIRKHAREKLELEDLHRRNLEELTEKVSLGHSLNERIQSILNRTKKDLEQLSGKDVKILILVDFNDSAGTRHTRSVFAPKDQIYTFEIGNPNSSEYKTHHNPDLRTHFM
jgi:hypothetical protein